MSRCLDNHDLAPSMENEITTTETGVQPSASTPANDQKDLCDVCEQAFRGLLAFLEDADIHQVNYSDLDAIRARHSKVASISYKSGEADAIVSFRHHESWSTLLNASNSGCKVCKLLCHAPQNISKRHPKNLKKAPWLAFQHIQMDTLISPVQRCGVAFLWGSEEHASGTRIGPFEIASLFSSPLHIPASVAKSLPPVERIGGWIGTCQRHHPDCWASPHHELPTRLLEIEKRRDGTFVRLIQTKEHMAGTIRFVALSYCWGGGQSVSALTSSNIDIHMAGLPASDLPATFRDAVLICDRLNYRYLWIDSLCIIQDDVEDWQKESVRMAGVYSSAVFTIAASSAPNPHAGLLLERNPNPATEFAFRHNNGYMLPLAARQMPLDDHGPFESRMFSTSQSCLDTRAWALQEQLLSPRYVSFTKYQISMKCRRALFPERSLLPSMLPERHRMVTAQWSLPQSRGTIPSRTGRYMFRRTLLEYTKRHITYAADRLPAFSALARQFNQHQGDQYYAGLWKGTLMDDLLWSAETSTYAEINHDVPARPGTPTWSWASCETSVNYSSLPTWECSMSLAVKAEAEVLAAEVTLIGEDPYGQVDGGRMTIKGRTFACSTYAAQHIDMPGSRLRLAYLQEDSGHFFALASMDSLPVDGFDDGSLYFGLMLQIRPATDMSKQDWWGLLLKDVSKGSSNRVYQRVGMLTSRDIDNSMFSAGRQLRPERGIAKLLAIKKRTITIV